MAKMAKSHLLPNGSAPCDECYSHYIPILKIYILIPEYSLPNSRRCFLNDFSFSPCEIKLLRTQTLTFAGFHNIIFLLSPWSIKKQSRKYVKHSISFISKTSTLTPFTLPSIRCQVCYQATGTTRK